MLHPFLKVSLEVVADVRYIPCEDHRHHIAVRMHRGGELEACCPEYRLDLR